MDCISAQERRGDPHEEQGWRPSSAQMILPQDRQFGAGVKRGCRVAAQEQVREEVEREGFVESSRAAMAEVRSEIEEVVVWLFLLVFDGRRWGVEVPEAG
jgi:hypothetical protein